MQYPRPIARHRAPVPRRLAALVAIAGLLIAVITIAASAAAGRAVGAAIAPEVTTAAVQDPPAVAQTIPVPVRTAVPISGDAPAQDSPCARAGVQAAIDARDEDAAVAAMGGADAFLTAVRAGNAPCVKLDDPTQTWVVVNKKRAYNPVNWAPNDLAAPTGLNNQRNFELRAETVQPLAELAQAMRDAGDGELGVFSGFRSYESQQSVYAQIAAAEGEAEADRQSARAGFSEHQSGLAVDLVDCTSTCGTIENFGETSQARFLAENGWKYGWIVRYDSGAEGTSGYMPEPWHARYIGVALATAYHEGGYHTLEDFFGLPAAGGYSD